MENIYKPQTGTVQKIGAMSGNVKLLRVALKEPLPLNREGLAFTPGQFFMVGLWGYGESPFGGASSPHEAHFVDFGIRRVGKVTNALHNLAEGEEVTLRGPYGQGFPLADFEGEDIVAVTGGCGIPPIAALMEYVTANRSRFGRVYLLYGAGSPADLLFKERYGEWEKHAIKIILTVDHPTPDWSGHVGLVSNLVSEIKVNPLHTVATMCGPGPMTNALENILRPLGISDRRIFVSAERRMHCAVGKCQHCTTGEKYVCQEGPVFNFDEVQGNWD